ncbi:hypothetical protein BGZ60DRAFT_534973 [Tricladium varicosporioides]|nr:hypothetical protein BGZ60DRAFT_534973 [Hymenoscyphus varicosporioides]
MSQPSQTIDGQFVDPGKLIRLLQETYGEGENNFKVELRLNRYKIYAPQDNKLTKVFVPVDTLRI